jgi:LmbE family N-acetylglucosaminyl deacetylase
MEKVLLVAAHPDDELLGAGGSIIKHVKAGDEVYALILGQGAVSRDGVDNEAVKDLQKQARAAGDIIGFYDMFFCDFPDNAFDSVALLKIVKEVEESLEKIKPGLVLTHHAYDLNVDHRLTHEAVLTASRPCNDNAPHTIYSFETLSSTEWQNQDHQQFKPTMFVDIEETIDKKIEALSKYESEMRPYPHSRSPEGVKILAQYRGLQSNLRFAEAFTQVRKIKK